MKFSNIILAYFMIGAVLWGGGVIGWDNSGVVGVVVDDPASGQVDSETAGNVENSQNIFQQAAKATGGGALLAAVNVIGSFLEFVGWPLAVLYRLQAPIEVQVLLGGGLTTAFIAAFARYARGI